MIKLKRLKTLSETNRQKVNVLVNIERWWVYQQERFPRSEKWAVNCGF